jgi:hypothetical protein
MNMCECVRIFVCMCVSLQWEGIAKGIVRIYCALLKSLILLGYKRYKGIVYSK